jgi:hypothetical protein
MVDPRPLADSAKLARDMGADAVVVTGNKSGKAPTLKNLREAAQGIPVLIGSGLTAKNAKRLLPECDGAIVGTSLMKNKFIDPAAVDELMSQVERD